MWNGQYRACMNILLYEVHNAVNVGAKKGIKSAVSLPHVGNKINKVNNSEKILGYYAYLLLHLVYLQYQSRSHLKSLVIIPKISSGYGGPSVVIRR